MARQEVYRRLVPFLRPHWWRMAGTVLSSVTAAALDGFAFALLIPFLNALFGTDPLPIDGGWVTTFLRRVIGDLQRLPAGWGILADDLLAGAMAAGALWLAALMFPLLA